MEAGSAGGVFWLERSAPSLFATAQIVRVKSDGSVSYEFTNAPVAAPRVGETLYLTFYGTGFRNAPSIRVQVAGRDTPLLYAGPQTQFSGLDQVNLQLSSGLLGTIPISLIADGKSANTITLRLE